MSMVLRFTIVIVYFLLLSSPVFAGSGVSISGYVREKGTNSPLPGVNVYLLNTTIGTTTDAKGYFTITVPTAIQRRKSSLAQASLTPPTFEQFTRQTPELALTFSLVGYETVTIAATEQKKLDIWLAVGQTLKEVIIRSSTSSEPLSNQAAMSRISVPVEQVNKIPALLGEKDILKVIQLMPGVQKGSEGSTNVYVRGGGPDQNLIILDDAVVYNPSHLFGFFSVFNGDVLRNVELTKGGFPAHYGGRLSSVIETTTKEGSREKVHGTGSVGLIASRLTLEGPLKTNKSSFLISGRRSYYGLLSKLLQPGNNSMLSSTTYFYDLNGKVSVEASPKDKLTLSGYTGFDDFRNTRIQKNTTVQSGMNWGNTAATLRWQHRFSEKLSSSAAVIYGQYQLQVSNQESVISDSLNRTYQLQYLSGVRDVSFKYDVDFLVNPKHQIRVGLLSTYHHFTPGAAVQDVTASDHADGLVNRQVTNAVESGIYAEDYWQPNSHWRIQGGLRLSYYQHPNTKFVRPEPRLSVAYTLGHNWSAKASYARMNQYVHILSNTGLGLPTDLWVPTTERVKPQQSEQLAAGLAKDFMTGDSPSKKLSLTVEGYYKSMNNIISFREGATFLNPTDANNRWEDNVTAGRGWAYGTEVMLQKRLGRLSGWVGYTLSWTKWQFDELNGGRPFYPRYDRRHNISVAGIFELTSRLRLSATWVYGTGQALTLPLSRYIVNKNNPLQAIVSQETGATKFSRNYTVRDYGDRNSFRTEPFHRLDVSLQYQRRGKHVESVWEVGVYNAYNRQNPFYYAMESQKDPKTNVSQTVLRRYSLFPAVPSISYGFKF